MKEHLNLKEQQTIKALYAGGKTCHSIAKKIQRSPHTVKKYLTSSQDVINSVQEIKDELIHMFEGMARKMLDSISPEDIQKINAYQRTVSAGICTDKAAALRGPNQEYPTTITLIVKNGGTQDPPITIDITPQPNTSLLPDEEPFK